MVKEILAARTFSEITKWTMADLYDTKPISMKKFTSSTEQVTLFSTLGRHDGELRTPTRVHVTFVSAPKYISVLTVRASWKNISDYAHRCNIRTCTPDPKHVA